MPEKCSDPDTHFDKIPLCRCYVECGLRQNHHRMYKGTKWALPCCGFKKECQVPK